MDSEYNVHIADRKCRWVIFLMAVSRYTGSWKAKDRHIRHKKFGEGTIVEKKGGFLIVQFEKAGRKQLNEKVCQEKGLIECV